MPANSIAHRLEQIQQGQQTNIKPGIEQSMVQNIATGEDARKARTRRLIQVGAITDQYLETSGLAPEDVAELLCKLSQLPEVRNMICNLFVK